MAAIAQSARKARRRSRRACNSRHQDAATGPALGIEVWTDYDEYGNPADRSNAAATGGPAGYAWLGADQRATDGSGLLLMGARLYNPTTGQFTSVGPVFGGNETAYAYPNDPIGMYDLDGGLSDSLCKQP